MVVKEKRGEGGGGGSKSEEKSVCRYGYTIVW